MRFSDTRESGRWTAIPTASTITKAAAAPTTAGTRLPALAPNPITMKTTSRPSSSTPLKQIVNAYQSRPKPDQTITSVATPALCLTATGTGNGAAVTTAPCNGSNDQKWTRS